MTASGERKVKYVLAPYDSASRRCGVSESLDSWIAMTEGRPRAHIAREHADIIPAQLQRRVGVALDEGMAPFVLGGDHSLTWFALQPVLERYGRVTVVHFDAHHDAYRSNILNHYTFIYHLQREMPVDIVPVGHRFDCAATTPRLNRDVIGPVYVTIDVDYFCPDLVKNVGHAVDCSDLGHCDFDAFASSLAHITGDVVAADLVEWKGSERQSPEFAFVERILNECSTRISAGSG